ncbi:MAG: hypothetical protein JNG89_20690 [Planctomycetaceae bacterium]|nr:hypothetical protein [Planctomycetaceae bacterium]
MFRFKPAVWKGGLLYELPRPVTSVRIQDSWDFARFKVPLAAGDAIAGRSANGVDIAIEGEIGAQAGALKLGEESMFAAVAALRGALSPGTPDTVYQFFVYHDAASATYRSFRRCTTVRFESDLSAPQLFSYSALIHAADPAIYSSAPG